MIIYLSFIPILISFEFSFLIKTNKLVLLKNRFQFNKPLKKTKGSQITKNI